MTMTAPTAATPALPTLALASIATSTPTSNSSAMLTACAISTVKTHHPALASLAPRCR